MHTRNSPRGFSIIEVVVVSAIVLVVVVAVAVALPAFFSFGKRAADVTQGAALIEEASEALLVLRDLSWDTHIAPRALGTPYALVWNGSAYALAEEAAEGPYRTAVTFSEVRRNGADVVSASGTLDPNTRRATIAVYKAGSEAPLASADMLIHNSYDN